MSVARAEQLVGMCAGYSFCFFFKGAVLAGARKSDGRANARRLGNCLRWAKQDARFLENRWTFARRMGRLPLCWRLAEDGLRLYAKQRTGGLGSRGPKS